MLGAGVLVDGLGAEEGGHRRPRAPRLVGGDGQFPQPGPLEDDVVGRLALVARQRVEAHRVPLHRGGVGAVDGHGFWRAALAPVSAAWALPTWAWTSLRSSAPNCTSGSWSIGVPGRVVGGMAGGATLGSVVVVVVLVVVVELVDVVAPGTVEALDGPAGLEVGVVVGPAGVVVVVDPGTLVVEPGTPAAEAGPVKAVRTVNAVSPATTACHPRIEGERAELEIIKGLSRQAMWGSPVLIVEDTGGAGPPKRQAGGSSRAS